MRLLRTSTLARPSAATLRSALVVTLWVVPLAVLEVLGRVSPTDVTDAVGALCLFGLAVAFWVAHAQALTSFARGPVLAPARAGWRRHVIRIGFDLRREPRLPSGAPVAILICLAAGVLVAAALWWAREFWPTRSRAALRDVSGLVYLGFLASVWIAMTAIGAGATALACARVGSLSIGDRALRERERTLHVVLAVVVAAVLLTLASVAPRRWAVFGMIACGAAHALTSALMTRQPLLLVWDYAHRDAQARRLPHWVAITAMHVIVLACVVALTALTGGDRLYGDGASQTGLTAFLGACFAWTAAIGFGIELLADSAHMLRVRREDPTRAVPTRVVLAGGGGGDVEHIKAAGMRAARGPVEGEAGDVEVIVTEHVAPRDPLMPGTWPRATTSAELRTPATLEALRARDRARRRRELKRRLARLLKEASAADRNTLGYWIAPHLAFVTHLSSESDDEDGETVTHGPPYWRVLSRAARSHMFEVLEALEIDLLFVERGVGHRRLARVLDLLFEYYDLFGARRLEDERHFTGVPGVRVLIQECVLGEGQRKSSYPEPDYDELGRARVLHVYLDRGGADEVVDVPAGLDWTPVPLEPVG